MNIATMEMSEIIEQINKFAAIKKTRTLTDEESAIREELKKRYLELFRSGFTQQLQAVKVVDENGKDITPNKIKELKNKGK